MKTCSTLLALATALITLAPVPSFAASQKGDAPVGKVFPFEYRIDDLENGLRLVTVPLPYPDLVAFYAVVRTGSRNEVEPGKSGFAHFFEHMMFRGTKTYPPDRYNAVLKKMGAEHNAFTTDDFTAYHMVIGKNDLEKAMEVEADRFQNLEYPVEAFRTEAKAVLGEYNKNSANPISKLFEVMQDRSFTTHTYKHTTMGFLKDIEAMPDQFEYSRTFFDRFYRPENVVLLVVGDVDPARTLALTKRYWGGWKRGGFTQKIPVEPAPAGPYTATVDWPTVTLPWVAVAYRGPAFTTTSSEMAALDVAADVAFSESSDLYRRLVIEEQKVDTLFTSFRNNRDPGLLMIAARVKEAKDVPYVREAILSTIDGLKRDPIPLDKLRAVKANLKYGLALSMDNTSAVARLLAQFIQLDPTPETINRVFALYDGLTPDDLQKAASAYFTDARRTIGQLAGPGQKEEISAAEEGAKRSTAPAPANGASADVASLLRPSAVPLVSFRLLFNVGAAHDPKGKEGLAALTASLLSEGGSRTMSYEQIVKALYPMAASVSSRTDKEMTVFAGTTHRDNLAAYYGILSSMLLDPGWNEEDFNRVRDDAVNYLKVNLRGNNDEELGKEALYIALYGPGHPYGHETTGRVSSLEKLTLEDVREFYRKHYTAANLVIGLSGGYPEEFPGRVKADFARLGGGPASKLSIQDPAPIRGQHLQIIKKDTRSTAFSIGFPIGLTRAKGGAKEWAALWIATSWLGQHRSSNSHLYQVMREARGLNYGDYAYLEYFPRGMFQFQPDSNLGRQSQIFQIWIRPVEPANGHFALRIALYEMKKLIENGLSQEEFEQTREFLDKYAALLAQTQSARLGYALDGVYYGTGDFVPWARKLLSQVTRDDVNRAIREHLDWEDLMIVAVTKDAEGLRRAIVENAPSPIAYNAPKPAAIMEEDKVIERFPLSVAPDNATIVEIDQVFE